MAEWERVVQSTITDHLRDETVAILRNRKLTAMLREKGRIKLNCSGKSVDWRVRAKRNSLTPYADMDTIEFPRFNRHLTAELDWRGYRIGESISDKEIEMNKGTPAILNLWADLAEYMKDDFMDNFADELYVDGNAAGNTNRIHGIESFMGNTGAAAQGYVGVADDSYAGQPTILGGIDGSWDTNTWPAGTGDASYDCWSPLIVDYTDAAWLTGSTWASNCIEVLHWLVTHANRNKTQRGMLDTLIVTQSMMADFKNALDPKQRIEAGNKESPLVKLGFGDVINYDGIDITSEYGIPDTKGYGFNFSSMELRCLKKQLVTSKGPIYVEQNDTYRLLIGFWGNMLFRNPRDFVMLDNLT